MKLYNITNEIIPLTSFRFFTAFIVFLFHARINLNWTTNLSYIDRFIWEGAIFMSAFFVLSGFILTHTYRNISFNKNLKALRNYYIKRFARIYPVYIVVLIASSYLLFTLDLEQIIVIIIMNIFLLESVFYTTYPNWLNGGMWSISVEAFFYAIFPYLKQVFDFFANHKIKLFFLCYFLAVFPSVVKMTFGGTADIYVNPLFRLGEFGLGMLVAMVYLEKTKKRKYYSQLLISSIIILFLIVVSLSNFIENWFFTGFNFAILPLLCLIIFSIAQLSSKENKVLFNWFCHPLFRYLGKISYSFYMVQFFVIDFFGKKILHDAFSSPHMLVTTLLVINIVLSILLYEIFEKRMRYQIVKKYCVK